VRLIFDRFVNASVGLRGIAGVLNHRGVSPPCTNGGPRRRHARPGQATFWRSSTVRYILINPAYYGAITFNRRSLSKFWRIEKNAVGGDGGWQQIEQNLITQRGIHLNGQQHWVQDVVRPEAAIVSQDIFERAQRKLAHRAREKTSLPRDRHSRFLLSGLLRCQCGSRMNGVTVIPTFNEDSVREAILNAVSHRDYRHAGSVFVRQFQRRLEVVSPGGFPPGVTPENILDRQLPRNRRLADAFEKCGLVERSGQGANRMFEACILEAKPLPDFTGTDAHQVSLILHGQVQDVGFLRFLEKVGQERLRMYSTHDLLALDLIHRNQPLPETVRPRVPRLVDDGLVERSGRGKFILSRQFHAFLGKKGAYTRRKGLDRETNKALLLKHIQDDQAEGSQLRDLAQVLPALSHRQVQGLLRELRSEGRIHSVGRTNAGRWYPGPEQSTIAPKPK